MRGIERFEVLKWEGRKALIRMYIPRSKLECSKAQNAMNIIRSQSVGAQLRFMVCILFGDQERESTKAQLEKHASLHAYRSLDQRFVDVYIPSQSLSNDTCNRL